MANTSRINGFKPVKHLTGAPYNGQFNLYEIVAADAVATFVGDIVVGDAGTGTEGLTTVSRAAAAEITGGRPIGVVVGFVVPTPVAGSLSLDTPQYRAASVKRIAMVADAPDLVFEVQDGATVPISQTLIGLNAGYNNGSGSTTTGTSAGTTGATAPTTTDTLPLKILGMVNRPDNEYGVASQKLLVMINSHAYNGMSTAI